LRVYLEFSDQMNNKLYEQLKGIAVSFNNKFLDHISIDCVVFGYHDKNLKVLLTHLKNAEAWGLPGGFVRKNLSLQDAAIDILKKRTGAENIFLHQFKAFGELDRTSKIYKDMPDDLWFKQRFISLGYYALVDYQDVEVEKDSLSDAVEWHDISEIPEMMMDHGQILQEALVQLRKDLNYKPVGLNLLPEKFTMPELQILYEIILCKKLNRGNFYRKMINYKILEKLDETRKGGAHKSPDLYSFNIENYNKAMEDGFKESW